MAAGSKIEWTEATWSPVTGCTRIGEGCEHCYIERTVPFRMARRKFDGAQIGATTGVQLHRDRLDQPLHWRRPRRVFVNSMSDLFHEDVPDEFIAQIWAVMALAGRHTFQLLTKRPARMRALLSRPDWRDVVADAAPPMDDSRSGDQVDDYLRVNALWPLPNVWLGVSTESQKWADIRVPILLDTPAAVRWISAEPLLGPLDVSQYLRCGDCDYTPSGMFAHPCAAHGCPKCGHVAHDEDECTAADPFTGWCECSTATTPAELRALDWVVCGGETGPGSRPMHPAWARALRDQCGDAGVPFFLKQHGDWAPLGPLYTAEDESDYDEVDDGHMDAVGLEVRGYKVAQLEPDGTVVNPEERQAVDGTWLMARVGKKKAGRQLDGRTWDEFPEAVQG